MYRCFIFKLNRVKTCSGEIHICLCCGKTEDRKICLKLKLGISENRRLLISPPI
jgi:hypothetical protein